MVGQGWNMVPPSASFAVPLFELNSPNNPAASGWSASSCIG